jgi:tetratricopeptide (TPR) repeat protein
MTRSRLTRAAWLAAAVLLLAVGGAQAGFDEAMDYFKAGKYLEAAGEFQALVDEAPEYDYGYFMLGVCYVKTGKPADAQRNFTKAIELNADKFEYHFAQANVQQRQGEYAKVVSTLDTAEGLLIDSHKFNFYQLRGFAKVEQQEWDGAVADLQQAADLKKDPRVLTQLGKVYFTVGEYEKAVEKLREAGRVSPDDPQIPELVSRSLLNLAAKATNDSQKKGRYAEALTAAQQYLKLDPSGDARYLAGRAALGAGDYDTAIDSFKTVLSKTPDSCNAMVNMGNAYIAKKDWANALQALNNATSCAPSMDSAWQNKGFVLQKQGSESKSIPKYREAIAAYEQANKLKPSSFNANGIEVCRNNITVFDDNTQMAQEEAAQDAESAAADAAFADAQARDAEWKRKVEEGD